MHILVVKTSSLGDVIHALPAVTDAARERPGIAIDWLVEGAFRDIPAWHPAVQRVICCDMRGWRRNLLHTLFGGSWARFTSELRQTPYDLIIDAQGLVKSAWLAGQANGVLAGADRASAREPLAALFYQKTYPVPRFDAAHAIDRSRSLFAQALGYTMPASAPDAGLGRDRFAAPELSHPYVVLLHGTTWPSKRWPVARWASLATWIASRGLRVVLPWGNADERAIAEEIAATSSAGLVLPKLGLTALAGWLAHARACVGVDTGLAHLAAALGTPQVSLYGPTLPRLTGANGAHQLWLISDESANTIDRSRQNTVALDRVIRALQVWL